MSTQKTEKNKKKKVSLPIIIISAIIVAVLVAGLVLGLIRIKSFDAFVGYDNMNIYCNSSNAIPSITEANEPALKKEIDKGFKKSGYSVLRGVFEGVFSNSLKFKLEDKEELQPNGSYKTIKAKEVVSGESKSIYSKLNAVQENEFVLHLRYSKIEKVMVEKEEIAFDNIIVVINDSENTLLEYTLFFFEDAKTRGDDAADYEINPILMRANTSVLYKNLVAIRDAK